MRREDDRWPREPHPVQDAVPAVLDDRPLVVLGLHAALAGVVRPDGLLVVGRTPRALEAVQAAAARGRPVVVLVDDVDSPGGVAAALAAGARGVALAGGSVAELLHVVARARAGEVAVAAAVSERLDELERLRALFTPREREVLRLYATGLPAKSVARRLRVGLETVKTYLKRMREKAKVAGIPTDTRLELADLARRLDLQ
ncbi:helix-turn-helix transcriptional regulator [Streptomyces sp. NP160]|uniref:helix-turn-helix transcriptional regulator n=1 Tax=Streptomyces sp. NP160 TaxID=2586637 RepID=UPI00111A159E|nr:helix-turn-helix domain-containing protein [Streptomyces sp. NP160]TNM59479.1 helix-turn-helix transcriptional regulator [Streptomyces sp. NP160]